VKKRPSRATERQHLLRPQWQESWLKGALKYAIKIVTSKSNDCCISLRPFGLASTLMSVAEPHEVPHNLLWQHCWCGLCCHTHAHTGTLGYIVWHFNVNQRSFICRGISAPLCPICLWHPRALQHFCDFWHF